MANRSNVKEEGQQCNLDEQTQGICTTVNMSTPEVGKIGDKSNSSRIQQNLNQSFEEEFQKNQVIHTDKNYNSSFYYNPRSQTAASQYLSQVRQKTQERLQASKACQRTGGNSSSSNQRVKMTRSLFKYQQNVFMQKIGIPLNARPLSKQSGAIEMLVIQNKNQNRESYYNSRQDYSRNAQSRNQDQEIFQVFHKTQLSMQTSTFQLNATQNNNNASNKSKDGGYISFQTNVDNSQAIIPMILTNEDLMKTTSDENQQQHPQQVNIMKSQSSKSNEDLKKTILSRQFNNNQKFPARVQSHIDATHSQGRSASQMQPRITQQIQNTAVYIHEQQQASSEEYSYQLSKRNIHNFDNPYSGMVTTTMARNQSRNYKSHNTSKLGGYRTVYNLNENINSNNFLGAQQLKNFQFEQIPDYSENKNQQIKEQYIRKIKNQSLHEGRNYASSSDQNLSLKAMSQNKLNQTAQIFTSQPLFLTSTKKTPGLQKECSGSYVSVINNRTCLGQQNVFKFSMDLPLRLKQQMWRQHQLEKENQKAMDEAAKISNEQQFEQRQVQEIKTSLNKPQIGLEVIGTQSRLQEMLTPTQYHTNQQQNNTVVLNQSSSLSNLEHGNHRQWSPTSLIHNTHQNAQTAEISKKDLLQLDRQQTHSPYMNQASVHRYQESTPKQVQSQPYLSDPSNFDIIKPSQLKLNIQDSNIYSQAMSSENNSDRGPEKTYNLHQNEGNGKKSKIIYSINKSSQNKNNSVQRSKNNAIGMDIIINSGAAQLKRSLESRNSKKGVTSGQYGGTNINNRSTITSKQNNEVSIIMHQQAPLAESGAISSMLVSQEKLLPITSGQTNEVLEKAHWLRGSQFKPVKTQKKEDSFADKSPDLMHLSKHPFQHFHSKETVQMPVIRSQNPSFKKDRKITSAGKRQKSYEFENPMQQHIRNESQRLKMTSIEFEPEKEFEHLHDFNITQISIKVDSKRNALDLSSNLRLKTAIAKHKSLDNKSIGSQSSKVNFSQPNISSAKIPKIRKTKEQLKSTRNKDMNLPNNFLTIQQLSIHDRNLSGQEVIKIFNKTLSPENFTLEDPKQDPSNSLSRYNTIRIRQIENKTIQLKSRAKSAAPNTKKGIPFVRAMTLVAPIMEYPNLQSNTGKKQSQESSSGLVNNSNRFIESEGPPSSVEATHLQLMKMKPAENIRIDPDLMGKLQIAQIQPKEIFKFQTIKTESEAAQKSDSKFMIIKENPRDGAASPVVPTQAEILQSQKAQQEEELMRKSTISIGFEDVGFVHQTKNDEGNARKISGVNDYIDKKDNKNTEDGDRYQLQAAMMEKVVVKSPGRQTTDHVVSSFNQEAQTVSNFNIPLLSKDNSNQHHRRLSSAGKKGSNSHSRRRSLVSNNRDILLQENYADLSPQSAAKRTVLIRKSRGQNDLPETFLNTNIGAKESTRNGQDKNGNLNTKISTYGNKVSPKKVQYGNSLPPNQFLTFEDIDKQQLNNLTLIQAQSGSKLNQIGKLPRHGHAAPSVVKRNKETLNKKKAEREGGNFSTNLNQNQSFYGNVSSKNLAPQASTVQPNKMAATFYVLPVSQLQPIMNPQSSGTGFYKTEISKKSKTPTTQSVYGHTSQMQALVIHQSEMAIDSSQQRMQLRLIQAYHDHSLRMKIMETTPLLLQNERVVNLSQLAQPPQVMVPQTNDIKGNIQDSKIFLNSQGVDSSIDLTLNNALNIRESASLASIKGEVVLTGRTQHLKSSKQPRMSNVAKVNILHSKTTQRFTSDLNIIEVQQINSSKEIREQNLSIVGTNIRGQGEQHINGSKSGNL